MNIEKFRDYCLSLPAASEGMPFDDKVLVFKVAGKMFALTDIDAFESVNLKCNPDVAEELRERYAAVEPGYHMSKRHWNTIRLDGSIADSLVLEWTKESYDLVVKGLTRKQREEYGL